MDWVRQAVADNMPFDVLTRELLSAEGMLWENGAVGYYIRDKGMPSGQPVQHHAPLLRYSHGMCTVS